MLKAEIEGFENRGDAEHPYGFVYFSDGKRCVYAYLPSMPGERTQGAMNETGGWEPITEDHVSAANTYLAEQYPDKFIA